MDDPPSDPTDHYEVLGVARDASVEEIILGYRLVLRTILEHPELASDDWNVALAEQAFHTLSHADLRADYDNWLAEVEGRRPPVVTPRGYLLAQGEPPAPAGTLVPVRRALPALPPPVEAKSEDARATDEIEPVGGPERRALLRLRREGRVRGRMADGRAFVATLHDVSPKGLSFVTSLAFEVGAQVELRSDALLATAVVRNRRAVSAAEGVDEGDGDHVVGVEFLRVHFRSQRGTFLSTTA